MKKIVSSILVLSLTMAVVAFPSHNQDPAKSQPATPALTTKDVLDMMKAGLTADIIVAKIKSSETNFDTTPTALAELKAANVVLVSFVPIAAEETREKTTPKIEFEYRLLATNRTTTMEKEMNDAAAEGYRFMEVISGETFFGGSEALVVMIRAKEGSQNGRFEYKLLATTKTSTLQKELQTAGDAGFEHRGQSVFKKTFGTEVMAILERDREAKPKLWDYKLLATRKTSTMQKEVMEAAAEGYQFVGFSTGSTFFGGNEMVTIMRRPREQSSRQ